MRIANSDACSNRDFGRLNHLFGCVTQKSVFVANSFHGIKGGAAQLLGGHIRGIAALLRPPLIIPPLYSILAEVRIKSLNTSIMRVSVT